MLKKLNILANSNSLTDTFDCKKCHHKCNAECCSSVPLPIKLIKRNAELMQRKVVKWVHIDNECVVPETECGKCPFLKDNYECAIYKWRPTICRLYGTEVDHNMTCHYQDKYGNVRNV
jgi:Fe-S-cluster containining protein